METIDGRQLSTKALKDVFDTVVLLGVPCSIMDIARRSGWSSPTVSAALAELVSTGQVHAAHVGKLVKYSPVDDAGRRVALRVNELHMARLERALDDPENYSDLPTMVRRFLVDAERIA